MKPPKIICVIPVLPSDLNIQTLQSIMQQTVPVAFIILLTEKANAETLAARVSKVLNDGVKHIRLENFDYILRVDGDAAIPSNFIEANLKGSPDVLGLGCAMLIKISSLQKAMNAEFDPYCDDSAIHYQFMRHNMNVKPYTVQPIRLRQAGETHDYTYWLEKGQVQYQLGFEPIHVLAKARFNWRNLLCLLGYFTALIKRKPKSDFAGYVRFHQLQRLIHPRKGFQALRGYTPFNKQQ